MGTARFGHAAGVGLVSLTNSNGGTGVMLAIDLRTGAESTVVNSYDATPLYPNAYDAANDIWYYTKNYDLRRVNGSAAFGGPTDVRVLKGCVAPRSRVDADVETVRRWGAPQT